MKKGSLDPSENKIDQKKADVFADLQLPHGFVARVLVE